MQRAYRGGQMMDQQAKTGAEADVAQSRLKRMVESIVPSPIHRKLVGSTRRRDVLSNINWLVLERLLTIGTGVLVGAQVARYLGSTNYGKLSYATSFVSVFVCMSTMGLDQLIVRDAVIHPDEKNELLGTAFLMKLFGSFASSLLASGLIFLVRPDSPAVRVYVVIVALSYILRPFDVITYWFQAQVRSKHAVLPRLATLFVVSGAKIVLVLQAAPVIAFSWIVLVDSIIAAVGLLAFYERFEDSILQWRFKLDRMRALLTRSWPLIIAAVAVSVHAELGGLMLGNMLDDGALGVYAAAKRLMQWSFVATVIANSAMPVLVDTREQDEGLYYERLQKLYDIMIWLAVGVSVVVTLTAGPVVSLLYGPEYAGASAVLSILSWTAVFNFFGIATSRYLVAENLTAIQLYRTLLGTGLNITLNAVLIPRYGVVGASVAILLSVAVQGCISTVLFRRTRRAFLMFVRALNLYRIIGGYLGV